MATYTTFAGIKTHIQNNLGRGTSNATILALIDSWVNNRQRVICRDRNFHFLRTNTTQDIAIVAAITSYNYPVYAAGPPVVWLYKDDGVFYLIKSGGTEPKLLKPKTKLDVLKEYKTDSIGEPKYIVFENTQYTLYPAASKAYTLYIDYYGYLPDLVDTTNESNWITLNYPDLLVNGGTAEGFAYLQEYQDEATWEAKFQREMNSLRAHSVSRKLPRDLRVVPRVDADRGTIVRKKTPNLLKDYY